MSGINFEEAKIKINEAQQILSKLDHVVTLSLHPQVYSNGNRNIDLSEADKEKLELEYGEIREELKEKIKEIPK